METGGALQRGVSSGRQAVVEVGVVSPGESLRQHRLQKNVLVVQQKHLDLMCSECAGAGGSMLKLQLEVPGWWGW